MTKLSKKQEKLFKELLELLHELVLVKHTGKRTDFEKITTRIKEAIEEAEK